MRFTECKKILGGKTGGIFTTVKLLRLLCQAKETILIWKDVFTGIVYGRNNGSKIIF